MHLENVASLMHARTSLRADLPADARRKPGRSFVAFGAFLWAGALAASLAGITLIWPDTRLERIWLLNPGAHQELVPVARIAGIAFLLLGAFMAATAVGWFGRRVWGWRLAIAILAIQVLGDFINCLRGNFVGGVLGVAIAAALLVYLLRARTRACFGNPFVT